MTCGLTFQVRLQFFDDLQRPLILVLQDLHFIFQLPHSIGQSVDQGVVLCYRDGYLQLLGGLDCGAVCAIASLCVCDQLSTFSIQNLLLQGRNQ